MLFLLVVETLTGHYRSAAAVAAPQPSLTVKAIAAGTYHMLALMSDGTVMSWGRNTAGQLGVSATGSNREYASAVKDGNGLPLSGITAISAGAQHSLALSSDGEVYSWGYNGSGELGRSASGNASYLAMKINFNGKKITQISAGYSQSLALDEDGHVWAWGSNLYGQLGDGTTSTRSTPVQVKASMSGELGNIKAVSAGQFHSLALTGSNEVLAWGMNTNGQLGDGTQSNSLYPVSVKDGNGVLTGVRAISAKGYNSFALQTDGDMLWAWGDNSNGQLGTGNYQMSTKAVPVLDAEDEQFGNVKEVAAGFLHTVAVKNDGTLWTWGSNRNDPTLPPGYQLGRNWDDASVAVPGRVTEYEGASDGAIADVVSAQAGNVHTSIIRSDGSVWSVGSNKVGSSANLSNVLGGNRTESEIRELARITFSTRGKTTWAADSAASATAGETVQVSLQLADSAGNPLNIGTDLVQMTADRGDIESVSYAGGGKFTAQFRSEQAGLSKITASVNEWEFPTKLSVQVTPGAPDAGVSTLHADPGIVAADGTSFSVLTLELKDEWGNAMTSHVPDVSLEAMRGTLGSLTELAPGKYEAQLTSTEAGASTVSVTLNGDPLELDTVVTFLSGDPDAANSVLEVEPDQLPANGDNEALLVLRIYDAFRNALTQSGGEVMFLTDLGEISTVTEATYGVYSASMTSLVPGKATVMAVRDGLQLGEAVEVNFVPFIDRIEFGASEYETPTRSSVATTVTATFWNGETADVTALSTYSVSNPALASVSDAGIVTGLKPGRITLTAQLDGSEATVPVVIKRVISGGGDPGPGTNPGTSHPDPGTSVEPEPVKEPEPQPQTEPQPVDPGNGEGTEGENPDLGQPGEGTEQPASFTDTADHWAQSAIAEAARRGIVTGYPGGEFRPQAQVTRAEFAVMLVRAFGWKGANTEAQSPHGGEAWPDWASEAIGQLMELGIVQGYSDGTFGPDRKVTRAEMTAIISRALELTPAADSSTKFADDSDIPEWAKPLVALAVELGIVQGRNGNLFAPNDTATRAEAVVLILRLLERTNGI